MTCDKCEKIQDTAFNKNIPESIAIAYVRIGISNVAIVGCKEHCKQLIEELRRGMLK